MGDCLRKHECKCQVSHKVCSKQELLSLPCCKTELCSGEVPINVYLKSTEQLQDICVGVGRMNSGKMSGQFGNG